MDCPSEKHQTPLELSHGTTYLWNTQGSRPRTWTPRSFELLGNNSLPLLIPHSLITSAVNKVWLLQTEDLLITQNDLETILKPWQHKLCFSGFSSPSSGCENTQIDTLQHENSAAKFSFVTNSNKRAPGVPCHFQFRRKRTNKLFPLGHRWQWAILCQLLLKAIRISGPKISFKIIIFYIHVAGCQL